MELKVRTLASGSSGNALLVAFGPTRVLVDAGIGVRSLCAALAESGVEPSTLAAVLVTHEHSDHIRGLELFCRRYPDISVWTSRGTGRALYGRLGRALGEPLRPGRVRSLANVDIIPFAISHDAAEPLGFRLECGRLAVAVATDLGVATDEVRAMLFDCQVLVVEANHDLDMLWRGPYPEDLKRRIASREGHLSNDQAAGLLAQVVGPQLRQVVLAHMSAENNAPELALAAVAARLGQGRLGEGRLAIQTAPRHGPGMPIRLADSPGPLDPPPPRQLGLPWEPAG